MLYKDILAIGISDPVTGPINKPIRTVSRRQRRLLTKSALDVEYFAPQPRQIEHLLHVQQYHNRLVGSYQFGASLLTILPPSPRPTLHQHRKMNTQIQDVSAPSGRTISSRLDSRHRGRTE